MSEVKMTALEARKKKLEAKKLKAKKLKAEARKKADRQRKQEAREAKKTGGRQRVRIKMESYEKGILKLLAKEAGVTLSDCVTNLMGEHTYDGRFFMPKDIGAAAYGDPDELDVLLPDDVAFALTHQDGYRAGEVLEVLLGHVVQPRKVVPVALAPEPPMTPEEVEEQRQWDFWTDQLAEEGDDEEEALERERTQRWTGVLQVKCHDAHRVMCIGPKQNEQRRAARRYVIDYFKRQAGNKPFDPADIYARWLETAVDRATDRRGQRAAEAASERFHRNLDPRSRLGRLAAGSGVCRTPWDD